MSGEWEAVTSLPSLESHELQLWRIHLNNTTGDPNTYRQYLSTSELDRSDRFRAPQVRLQFVVARACLRILLGNLLNLPPHRVPITLSAYGKPETTEIGNPPFFNVAHSRDTILIALSGSGSVGVDLEYLDRDTDILEVARHSFTELELGQITQISNPFAQRQAFFRCWTRKEAVLKADGRGLSLALNSIEVPVHAPAASIPVLIASAESPNTWFVTDIALGQEIAGAFAAALPGLVPRTLSFPIELLPGR